MPAGRRDIDDDAEVDDDREESLEVNESSELDDVSIESNDIML